MNGKNLKTLDLREYRNKIGYVGQEPFLFNQTIKENLLNSKPGATDVEIIHALEEAQANKFIKTFPKSIETDVGAIGSKISGGQKQRIAIARALIRKPSILILDEATNSLDKRNEQSVQEAINNIENDPNMITVVIAHDLSTIQNADKIYVLEQGKICEEGTHNELIANDQIYAKFYKAQAEAASLSLEEPNIEFDKDDISSEMNNLNKDSDKDKQEALNNDKYSSLSLLRTLYKYNKPKWLLILAFLGSLLAATGYV